MQRMAVVPRSGWRERVQSAGMQYHTIDGEVYWDESACYSFTPAEVDRIEEVTEELHGMCLAAVEHIISQKRFDLLRIPADYIPLIVKSWESRDVSMYGRFDFSWDGSGAPKMLEYNADTPTALLEASVVQWFWLKDQFADNDQFNSIHEKLLDFWKEYLFDELVHFACLCDTEEDLGNIEYVRDIAVQAGYRTKQIFVEDIGWSSDEKKFVDLDNEPITAIFKLYPWEWMFTDEFGKHLHQCNLTILEPAWKALLSNKGMLPILWELYPDHPNLLPSYFENRCAGPYVRKPLLSREGNNVTIYKNGGVVERPGTYGLEGFIYQAYAPLPEFDGNFTSIGSWIINGKPAGIGIREDKTEITTNTSRFIPHMFKED